MTRPEPAPRVRVPHGDLQGFGTCTALVLEGYFLLLLADPRNAPFFGILFLAGAWRLVQARRGAQPPLDWSRTHVRVAVPIAALGLGFGSAAALAPGLVHFFGAVVVWLEAVLLLSRGRESMLLRALACLSLVHVVLAAFVARPAATVPLLFVYLFLVVRTLGIANEVLHLEEPDGRFDDSRTFRQALAAIVQRLEPDWGFLPWLGDSHPDHSRISRASSEILRRTGVDKVLYYETWNPVPATHVVDITSVLETKKAAVLCHATALKYGNYLDAMLGLNAYRALYLPPGERRWAEAYAVTGARDNRFL